MFDGVPDQFHQFIAASRTSLPIPLSFPLHGASPSPPPPAAGAAAAAPPLPTFPSFDHAYHLQHVAAAQHHQHILHHHQKKDEEQSSSRMLAANLMVERDRSMAEPADPWSNDEVLTLLRIRSSMDSWFPDFTWEHVSRKLAELGFKKSAEKCKEKFEEESRHFNSLSYNKNYRFFSELDELYHGENVQVLTQKNPNLEKKNAEEKEENEETGQSIEAEYSDNNVAAVNNIPSKENEEVKKQGNNSKKRKRKYKFEMVKDFCEAIVNKMMALQEELHNKFMEDMLKRDEEMIAREEAWKHQEMDRLNKEIEIRVKEQALANDRQAMLIDFLKNFTSSGTTSQDHHQNLAKMIEDFLKTSNCSPDFSSPPCEIQPQTKVSSTNNLEMASSSSLLVGNQNPSSVLPTQKNPVIVAPSSSSETQSLQDRNPSSLIQSAVAANETSSSTPSLSTQNPSLAKVHDQNPLTNTPSSSSYKGSNERSEDVGKRWPRDEVLALINLRCSLVNNNNNNSNNYNNNNNNNNGDDNNRSEGAKGPLWERISQGMQQLGYKRSAKRCKEKWENINKYFRKTKDNNKKRSLDSRTCPYYHQLSSLYSQGVLVAPTDTAAAPPENHSSTWPKNQHSASAVKTPENCM